MKDNKDLLGSVLKTTQMGQIGIRSVLNLSLDSALRSELQGQLKEFDSIEREVIGLARNRGWQLSDLDPAIKGMTNLMTRSRLSFGNTNSKAAAMMIQGNTRGIIKGYKNLNKLTPSDQRILDVAHRLIDCEHVNIQQLQGFL
ncbi:MAG: hypothetical protein IJB47_01830 [Oscillospiraceae bacterium]|nr:hypothetical protein [Oscillospiraceae bacterium]